MKSRSSKAWWCIPLALSLMLPAWESAAEQPASAASGDARDGASRKDPRRSTRTRARATEIENPVQEVEDLLGEVTRLEERFGKLQRDYGNAEQIFPLDEIRSQYEQATYLYLVEDYESAALRFYAVLEKSDRVNFPEFRGSIPTCRKNIPIIRTKLQVRDGVLVPVQILSNLANRIP